MAELEDAAKKLTIDEDGDGKPEIYGFLSRGWGRLTTASFASGCRTRVTACSRPIA